MLCRCFLSASGGCFITAAMMMMYLLAGLVVCRVVRVVFGLVWLGVFSRPPLFLLS